jgi:hypothetical protein
MVQVANAVHAVLAQLEASFEHGSESTLLVVEAK